ncbi:MAG: hypothetical protein KAU01_04300 [Candidatus Cloacimonetes bacterium]|nr:hypothetical protein [Candidatus Cloacimonadota bacterium]
MKKIIPIILLLILTFRLFSLTIITKDGKKRLGEIKKANSEKIYFVETKYPQKLLILKYEIIAAIVQDNKDITTDIFSDGVKRRINYNSFHEVINIELDFTEVTEEPEEINARSGSDTVQIYEKNKFEKNELPWNLYFSLKTGLEFGKLSFSVDNESESENANTGVSLSGEILKKVNEALYIGIGYMFQFPRKLDLGRYCTNGSFKNLPIYGLMRINIPSDDEFYSYLIGNLGYNKISGDLFGDDSGFKGGVYYGLGLGFQFKTVILEICYKNFGDNYDGRDDSADAYLMYDTDYEILSISLGLIRN